MKKIIHALGITATALLSVPAQAQLKKTSIVQVSNKVPTNLSWYTATKANFYKLQKNVTTAGVMARRNISGGNFIEIGPNFTDNQVEKIKSTSTKSLDDGRIVCKSVVKEMDLSIKPEFNILKASSLTKIFPGVIFTDQSVLDESLITAQGLPARKPMTLNISLPGAAVSSTTLNNPGVIQMDLVNTLLQQNFGKPIPAMAGLSITEVDSKFDFAAQVAVSSGLFLPLEEFGIPAEVNAGSQFSGNVNGETKRKTYIVKFIQPMFVLFHNDPNSTNLFQDPNAAASRKNLVMINSVTYGRMVFIRVVSEANAISVKSALESKFGIQLTELNIKAGQSVEGSGNANFTSTIKEFKAVVIGGNNTTAIKVVSDANQLNTYLQDPTASTLNANTGAVPISFTMVRVSDYASLGIRSVGTFEALEECKSTQQYAIYINNFKIEKVVDNPLTGNNEDIFGTISVRAFYKTPGGSVVEVKDEQNRPGEVFSRSSSSVIQLKQGERHHMFVSGNSPIKDGVRRFIFTPDQIETGYIVVKFQLKDKIMKDGEDLGQSKTFVSYQEKAYTFHLNEWTNLSLGNTCTDFTTEIGGDAKICINFSKFKE